MTSATEELRRLLDERGVELSAPSGLNARYADSMTFIGNTAVISEIDGSDLLRINFDGTPEQAIDATLDGVGSGVGSEVGSEVCGGKLTAEQVREAIERNVTFYEGGDYDEQEIADELRRQFGGFKRVVIDVDGEQHEFNADSLIRLLEDYEDASRWHELFGTPERAARTIAGVLCDHRRDSSFCLECELHDGCYGACSIVEWLSGEGGRE